MTSHTLGPCGLGTAVSAGEASGVPQCSVRLPAERVRRAMGWAAAAACDCKPGSQNVGTVTELDFQHQEKNALQKGSSYNGRDLF